MGFHEKNVVLWYRIQFQRISFYESYSYKSTLLESLTIEKKGYNSGWPVEKR